MGWRRLCAELDQGKLLLALVDTEPLRACSYPGRPLHSAHTMVVNGYCPDTAYIVAPSPHKAFAGPLPLKAFALAWQAAALGASGFVWYSLRVPQRVPFRTRQELLARLRLNIETMLGGERVGWGLAGWIEEAAAWQEGAQAAWLAQAALGAGVGNWPRSGWWPATWRSRAAAGPGRTWFCG